MLHVRKKHAGYIRRKQKLPSLHQFTSGLLSKNQGDRWGLIWRWCIYPLKVALVEVELGISRCMFFPYRVLLFLFLFLFFFFFFFFFLLLLLLLLLLWWWWWWWLWWWCFSWNGQGSLLSRWTNSYSTYVLLVESLSNAFLGGSSVASRLNQGLTPPENDELTFQFKLIVMLWAVPPSQQ